MIFPEFAIFFLLAVLLPFRMALHRYKNLKKADGKKAVFLRKIYKKKNRKFVMMKRKNVLSISSQNQAQKDFGSTP